MDLGVPMLSGILQPGALGQYSIVGALLTFVPAAWIKMIMLLLFQLRVSYWLVLAVIIASVLITVAILVWVGLFSALMVQGVAPQPLAMLALASLMIELILLTAFVPDQHVQVIAMWKWLCVVLSHYAILAVLWFSASWFYTSALSTQAAS